MTGFNEFIEDVDLRTPVRTPEAYEPLWTDRMIEDVTEDLKYLTELIKAEPDNIDASDDLHLAETRMDQLVSRRLQLAQRALISHQS